MAEEERIEAGFCVEGVITAVKGNFSCGHKVGDKFDLSCNNTARLFGSFYNDIFPHLVMLQFGGSRASVQGLVECSQDKIAMHQ